LRPRTCCLFPPPFSNLSQRLSPTPRPLLSADVFIPLFAVVSIPLPVPLSITFLPSKRIKGDLNVILAVLFHKMLSPRSSGRGLLQCLPLDEDTVVVRKKRQRTCFPPTFRFQEVYSFHFHSFSGSAMHQPRHAFPKSRQ
jgi:hypothetical protein